MVRVVVFLLLADIALVILALIDCLSAEKYEVRNMPRWAWALVILFLSPIGPAAWFLAGRPGPGSDADVTPTRTTGPVPRESTSRQVAPDDNPEFLRDLAARTRKANEDRRRKWDDDLRKGDDHNGEQPPVG
jgi:hypothetical protein